MVKKNIQKNFSIGKRRKSVARATISEGSGKIFINSIPFEFWGDEARRLWVREPIILAEDIANNLDFKINASGGGAIGQTEAIRMSIARGIINFSKDKKIKQKFLNYDRGLLIIDPRRNESHHGNGASKRGSRRHKQRSKR